MLNNITNFFNLIKTGKVKTQLDSTDLLPIGTKDLRFSGQYQPTMIKYGDFISGLVGGSNGQILYNNNDTIAGAANLFWDNTNGRLGIGTTNPFSLLTVGGQSSFYSVQSAGTGSDFFYSDIHPNITAGANSQVVSLVRLRDRGQGNTGGFTGTQRLSLLVENAGGGEFPFQLFSETGALRIGYTTIATPTAKLEIRGSGSTSATTALLVQNSAGNNALQITDDRIVKVYNGLDLSGWYMYANGTSNASVFGGTSWIWDTTGGGVHTFRTTGNIERFRITDNGNALIGTTTDAGYKLDVNGTARVSGALTVSGNQILFSGSTTNTYITQNIGTGIGNFSAATCVQFQVNTFPKIIVRDTGSSRASTLIVGDNVATTESAHSSALLEVRSSSSYIKGFLPPRMTTTEKNAIASPAAGLMVYDNTLNRPCFYNGTSWITL